MKFIGIIKLVADIAVTVGVGGVVGNAIKLSSKPEMKVPRKLLVAFGGAIITGMVSDLASTWVEKKIDSAITAVKNVKDTVEKVQADLNDETQSNIGEADVTGDETTQEK